MDHNERVIVTYEYLTKLKGMKNAIKTAEDLRESQGLSKKGFNDYMKKMQKMDPLMFKAAKRSLNWDKRQKSINKAQRDGRARASALRASYLGLMFAGMALDRVFGSLIGKMFELLGVSKVWNAVITLLLLPVFLPLSQKINKLLLSLLKLPRIVKLFIGWLVIALGTILGAWGMYALAVLAFGAKVLSLGAIFKLLGGVIWGALKYIWGGVMYLWEAVLVPFISWVAGIFGVFGVALGIIIAVIVAITLLIFGAIEAWKNNFMGFKDAIIGIWDGIKLVIQGFVDFFKGIWSIIVGIFTGNTDKIKEGFKLMGEGIKNIFKGVANIVINIINAMIGLILAALAQVIRAAQWLWNKIPGLGKVTWYEDIMAMGANKQMIPSFATGGVMPYTGMAQLHKGETITPAGQSLNSSPTINIQASISNDYDVRRLADELSKYWVNDMERMSKQRGMI